MGVLNPANVLGIVARTAAAGFALVNGTPNIMQWTAPADGLMHTAVVSGLKIVSALETGGSIVLRFTVGGVGQALQLNGAGQAAGSYAANPQTIVVDPGSTVTVSQQAALTAGASTFYGAIAGQ